MIATAIYKFGPVAPLVLIVHGTSTADLVVLFAAIGWAVMIAKDIRPIKSLRSDLGEARTEIAEKDLKIEDLTAKLMEETARADKLEASRDFSTALAEALGGYEKRSEDRAKRIPRHHEPGTRRHVQRLPVYAKDSRADLGGHARRLPEVVLPRVPRGLSLH